MTFTLVKRKNSLTVNYVHQLLLCCFFSTSQRCTWHQFSRFYKDRKRNTVNLFVFFLLITHANPPLASGIFSSNHLLPLTYLSLHVLLTWPQITWTDPSTADNSSLDKKLQWKELIHPALVQPLQCSRSQRIRANQSADSHGALIVSEINDQLLQPCWHFQKLSRLTSIYLSSDVYLAVIITFMCIYSKRVWSLGKKQHAVFVSKLSSLV